MKRLYQGIFFLVLSFLCQSVPAQVSMSLIIGSTNDKSRIPVSVCMDNPYIDIYALEVCIQAPVNVNYFLWDEEKKKAEYTDTERWNYHSAVTSYGSAQHGDNALFISIAGPAISRPFIGNEGTVITVFFDGSKLADGEYTVKMFDALAITYETNSYGQSIDKGYKVAPYDATFSIKNGHVIGVMPTNVSLNKNYLLLTGTAQTEQLSSQVIPSNASQNIVWTSSDTNVATVNENGVVTPVANGIAIITATTTDGSNLNATCPVMVNIKKESTDVNGDGNVNTADVVAIYNFIINGE